MRKRLDKKVAIVTGAGRGIGRTVALMMAKEGASVIVNDYGGNIDGTGSSESPANSVVKEIVDSGGIATASHHSVSEFTSAKKIANVAINKFGHVDILCNAAGILRDRMIFNMSEDEWDDVLKVHLYGTFNMVENCVPHMKRDGYGRIVLFASSSGLGSVGQANYSSAKEGIVGLTRSLSNELSSYGISVNAVYPIAHTRMMASVPDSVKERAGPADPGISGVGAAELFHSPEPEEAMSPENNAVKILYLCTDKGGTISGKVISTGGWSISHIPERKITKSIQRNTPWTVDELHQLIPISLGAGLINPAPKDPKYEKIEL